MWTRVTCVCAFVLLLAVVCIIGCGGNDLVVGGMLPFTQTPVGTATPSNCGAVGDPCVSNTECCNLVCSPNTFTCL
jgi:hypothetical protein